MNAFECHRCLHDRVPNGTLPFSPKPPLAQKGGIHLCHPELGYQKCHRRWLAFVLGNHDGSEGRGMKTHQATAAYLFLFLFFNEESLYEET